MRHETPFLRSRVLLAFCGLAAAALSACATRPADPPRAAVLPTAHYKAEVADAPDQIALGVHPDGLSAHQHQALTDFVARWRQAGGGAVYLKLPVDAANGQAARSMTYLVQTEVESLGVPGEKIKLSQYTAGGPSGPILVSFEALTAKGPDCSGGWENLVSTMDNEPYKHFGCALTANMAVEVADPADLVAPSGLTPADNTRRQVVLGKYREGKITSSEKDKQADGVVSSAVAQ